MENLNIRNNECNRDFEINLKLESLHKEYENIINSVYDEIFVTNANGTVIFVNKAAERLYNKKIKDIIGRNVRDLENEGFFTPSVTSLVIRTKKSQSLIQTTKTGKKILVTAIPIFDKEGRVEKIVSNSRQIDELVLLCNELEEKERLIQQYKKEIKQLKVANMNEPLYYISNEMEEVNSILSKVAQSDISVLLLGESGVGKTMIAKFLHNISNQCQASFQVINCATIPETLLEAELFGYVEGAFTGAIKQGKAGLLEMANGGTIFLDEIGEIPFHVQAKLLQVLQERKFRRVGGIKEFKINFRLVTATNQDLMKKVKNKEFREDLYYRINGISITIPPLRERKEDISILASTFLEEANEKYKKNKKLAKEVLDVFHNYFWPGNVRELKNLIERLCLISENYLITINDLPDYILACEEKRNNKWIGNVINKNLSLKETLEMVEGEIFKKAFLEHKTSYRIAEVLGVSQPTAHRKMKKYLKFKNEL